MNERNETTSEPAEAHLLPLAAASAEDCDQACDALLARLRQPAVSDLAEVAASLRRELREGSCRRFLIASDIADAITVLSSRDEKRLLSATVADEAPSVAFLCSGQGAQYPGMGRRLYAAAATFRAELDHCCELLEPALGRDLRQLILPAADVDREAVADELNQTCNTQPALFVVEHAMAKQWMAWGVRPQAMIGHSIGEYTAACLAGVVTVEEALALVAARGSLMQSLPSGSMLSVPMAEEELSPFLDEGLSIAATNGPRRLVVSGPDEAIATLQERLAAERRPTQRLHTSHAFHSVMMEPILDPFTEAARKVVLRAPRIPYVSNVSGTWMTAEEATNPPYYARHLRQAVRYSEGVGELLAEPRRLLLEIGPGTTLISLTQRHPARQASHTLLASIPHPKDRELDQLAFVLESLGRLWLAGVEIDWQAVEAEDLRARTLSG